MNLTYQAQSGQSIYDLCLMTYGSLDKLVTLVKDSALNFTDKNLSGKKVVFDSELISDVGLSNAVKNSNKNYATAPSSNDGGSFDDSFDISFD